MLLLGVLPLHDLFLHYFIVLGVAGPSGLYNLICSTGLCLQILKGTFLRR